MLSTDTDLFREIVSHVEDVFYVREMATKRFLYLSPAFEALVGDRLDAKGKPSRRWLELVHPSDRGRVRDAYHQLLRGDPFDEEYRVFRADGQIIWVHDRAYLTDERSAGARRVIGVLRNITDLRNLERELNYAQRMEAIGSLAASITHDMGNILAGIGACAKVIARSSSLDEVQTELTQEIVRAVERGTRYVGHLLDYCRRRPPNLERVVASKVVGDVCSLLGTLLGDSITLEISDSSDEAVVQADPVELEQVIINLALNARDAMQDHGRLEIRSEAVELEQPVAAAHVALAPGRYVTIAVTDTGPGIDPEVEKHLFEPFFTTKSGGSGLGLSTAYAIVRRAGGAIRVESKRNEGASFTLYLPRLAAN